VGILGRLLLARVAELADAYGSGPYGETRGGSSPLVSTIESKDRRMKRIQFRSVFFGLAATLTFLIGGLVPDATASNNKGGGRLVIRRIPNLGNDVIVNLSVDGAAFVSILYGHNYETFLPAGRHVLLVKATPRAVFRDPWRMTLNVRSGQVYRFTALVESPYLVLRPTGY
jgi:hypothetical protein